MDQTPSPGLCIFSVAFWFTDLALDLFCLSAFAISSVLHLGGMPDAIEPGWDLASSEI